MSSPDPFAAIERMGREIAGAIAAEFANHRSSREPRVPESLTEPAAPNELAGELVDWVDFMSDIARESIFSMADFGDSRSASASGISGSIDLGTNHHEPLQFWLHAADGQADNVRPVVEALTNEVGETLPVQVRPNVASVEPGVPAQFELVPEVLGHHLPGTYYGHIRAVGVTGALPVVIEIVA